MKDHPSLSQKTCPIHVVLVAHVSNSCPYPHPRVSTPIALQQEKCQRGNEPVIRLFYP